MAHFLLFSPSYNTDQTFKHTEMEIIQISNNVEVFYFLGLSHATKLVLEVPGHQEPYYLFNIIVKTLGSSFCQMFEGITVEGGYP